MDHIIDVAASGIEALAVSIIVLSVTFGTLRFLVDWQRGVPHSYKHYKDQLGRGLLLGLELLVAADVVQTVVLDQTLQSVMTLGVLVVVRTLLSWSVVVEIEGRWPWRAAEMDAVQNLVAGRQPAVKATASRE